MNVKDCRLSGVKLIEPIVHEDPRGFFMESYNHKTFFDKGISMQFVQDNHSLSKEKGVLRGLHYQLKPKAQTKLIRVTSGSIFDVVVDIRKNSSTFGQWEAFELSARNKFQLLIPEGFAHGFCTLEANTEVIYKVDNFYSKEHDRGILWNDPRIGIEWPIQNPILSEKDSQQPILTSANINFV